MEKDYVEILKVKQEEESEIKKNSPASLPLNPTGQGWSGQEIRKKLSHSIIGEKGSVLALLNERLITIGECFNDINAGGGGGSSNFIGTVSAVAKNIDLEGEVGNIVVDNFILGYISEDIPIKVIVFSDNQEQRGIFEVNNQNAWSKIGVYKKEDLYSIDKGDTYGGTIIKVIDKESLNGFEVIKKSESFKPVISRTEPSYEDVYKYGDTWFKEIDGDTFDGSMMFGGIENEDNEIDNIGYSDFVEIELPKPYSVNDTTYDGEEVELPKPYSVNDTIDSSTEVILPKK